MQGNLEKWRQLSTLRQIDLKQVAFNIGPISTTSNESSSGR